MAYRPRTRNATHCPDCGTASVNVHGLVDCHDCDWSEGLGRH